MPLTDKLRAAVFARDKGVCAFSGISVWVLDHSTPFFPSDWPDHIRPASRGGKDVIDNLVCASQFHNRKKLNNTSDQRYLFRQGQPTEDFYWLHGELSSEQAEMLFRHQALQESDWYFNRALVHVLLALNQEWAGTNSTRVRQSQDWLGTARRRIATWRRVTTDHSPESFVRRGLVRYPDAPDIRLMLRMADTDEAGLADIQHELGRHYRANGDALHAFATAETLEAKMAALRSAEGREHTTEPLLNILRRNMERMTPRLLFKS